VEVDVAKKIEEALKEPVPEIKKVEKKPLTLGERLKLKNPALRFSDTESSDEDEAKATKTVDAILAKEKQAKVANDTSPIEEKKEEIKAPKPISQPLQTLSAPLGLVKKSSTFDGASLFAKPKPSIPKPVTLSVGANESKINNFEFKREVTSSPKTNEAEKNVVTRQVSSMPM